MADTIKFSLALALVAAGVTGFYMLGESALIFRVLVVLAGVLFGLAVAYMTESGQRFVVFAREAVVETKKVVWPSRKEAVQTTAAVFAFVLAMALFLWLTDKTLEWFFYDLVLGWKKL